MKICHGVALLLLLACFDLPFVADTGCTTHLSVVLATMSRELLPADTYDSLPKEVFLVSHSFCGRVIGQAGKAAPTRGDQRILLQHLITLLGKLRHALHCPLQVLSGTESYLVAHSNSCLDNRNFMTSFFSLLTSSFPFLLSSVVD